MVLSCPPGSDGADGATETAIASDAPTTAKRPSEDIEVQNDVYQIAKNLDTLQAELAREESNASDAQDDVQEEALDGFATLDDSANNDTFGFDKPLSEE